LQFKFDKIVEDSDMIVPTKRVIISNLATLFDPLGLISPLLAPAKVLFQDLCLSKIDWDEPLPLDKHSRWEEWIKSLRQVSIIAAPRSMQRDIKGEIIKSSPHGYGNASGKAYCATIYIVHETTEGEYSTWCAQRQELHH